MCLVITARRPGSKSASLALATHPDAQLEALVDQVVEKIVSAQQPDGYLNTHFIVTQPELRFKNLRDFHELFCAGHLVEAAVAHYQATGKRTLLDATCRYIDLIGATFGPEPGQKRGYDGHPELEMALVRLYHATGEERYLQMARFQVEERGRKPLFFLTEARERGEDPDKFWARTYEYCQAHAPIRDQDEVVGHAVRAMYLYSAAADLAREFHDPSLLATCERLWDHLVHRRMYLTGGIGPGHHNEGFTEDYDLPDETAYAESCAAIGLMFWNERMAQLTGDGRYADVIERVMYNGFLSGLSLDGMRFFYENPLASTGNHHRQEWYACPCCPPNLSRTLASIGGYFYATGPAAAWVHQYAQGAVELDIDGRPVRLEVQTRYPWDGEITLAVIPEQPQAFVLSLRVPDWCEQFELSVNGERLDQQPGRNGYLAIQRIWQPGDRVRLWLVMPIRPVFANPAARQLVGRVALQRGPLVYCLEGVDHAMAALDRISIDPHHVGSFSTEHRPELLGGVTVLRGTGKMIADRDWGEDLYRSNPPLQEEVAITAIPYYAWDNRAAGEMRVWLRAQ